MSKNLNVILVKSVTQTLQTTSGWKHSRELSVLSFCICIDCLEFVFIYDSVSGQFGCCCSQADSSSELLTSVQQAETHLRVLGVAAHTHPHIVIIFREMLTLSAAAGPRAKGFLSDQRLLDETAKDSLADRRMAPTSPIHLDHWRKTSPCFHFAWVFFGFRKAHVEMLAPVLEGSSNWDDGKKSQTKAEVMWV